MQSARTWVVVGAISAGIAVVTGAFGAHGLEDRLSAVYGDTVRNIAGLEVPATYKYLQDFNTAARYQMYHALGLIALGSIAATPMTRCQKISAWSYLIGTVLFSGSLYVLVLTGQRSLGMITPVGGVFLIVAWVTFAADCRTQPAGTDSAETAS